MEENNEPIHEQLNKTGSLAKASSSNTASKFRIDDSEEETPEPSTTTTSFLQDSSDEEDPQGVETTTTASAPSKKSTGKFMPNLGVKRNKTKQMDQEIIIEPQAATLKRDRPRFNDADLMVASGPFSMGPAVKGAQPSAAKPSGAAMPRQGGSGGGGGSSQGKGSSRDSKGKGGASTSIKEDDEDEDMYMPIGGPVVGHKAVDYGKKVIADKKIVAPRLEDELDKFDPFARYEDMAEDMDEDDAFDEWDVDSPVKPGGLTGGLFGVDEGGIGKVLTDAGDEGGMLLFQFPAAFPHIVKAAEKLVEAKAGKKKEIVCDKGIKNKDLDGRVGKLIVYKNGRTKLCIGDLVYDVAACPGPKFRSSVASLDVGEGACHILGDFRRKLVCSPDVEGLLA